MIVDEVNSNNEETLLWSDLTLEQLKKDCKSTRDMFGIELDVDYRFKGEEGLKDERNIGLDRTLQL